MSRMTETIVTPITLTYNDATMMYGTTDPTIINAQYAVDATQLGYTVQLQATNTGVSIQIDCVPVASPDFSTWPYPNF